MRFVFLPYAHATWVMFMVPFLILPEVVGAFPWPVGNQKLSPLLGPSSTGQNVSKDGLFWGQAQSVQNEINRLFEIARRQAELHGERQDPKKDSAGPVTEETLSPEEMAQGLKSVEATAKQMQEEWAKQKEAYRLEIAELHKQIDDLKIIAVGSGGWINPYANSTQSFERECGFPKITNQTWDKFQMDERIYQDLTDAQGNKTTFIKQVLERCAPGDSAMSTCGTPGQTCDFGDCHAVTRSLEADERAKCWAEMTVLKNFNNQQVVITEAIRDAIIHMHGEGDQYLRKFSEYEYVKSPNLAHDGQIQVIVYSVGVVLALVAAACALTPLVVPAIAGPAIATGGVAVADANIANAVAMASQGAQQMQKAGLQAGMAAKNAIPALSSTWKSGFDITGKIVGSISGPGGQANVLQANIQKFLPPSSDKVGPRPSFLSAMHNLTTSQLDAFRADGYDIIDGKNTSQSFSVFQKGRFLETQPLKLQRDFTMAMRKHFSAIAINWAWTRDTVYIVASKGNCQSDYRGPQHLKVCLREEPNWVYYIYLMSRWRAKVFAPVGISQLVGGNAEYGGLTLEDAVRQSWYFYKRNGLKSQQEKAYMQQQQFSTNGWINAAGLWENQTMYPGVFTIPIALTPGGEAISTLGKDDGKNLPCITGYTSWSNSEPYGDESDGFLKATELYNHGDWGDWCHEDKHLPNRITQECDFDHYALRQIPSPKHGYKYKFKNCDHNREHHIHHPGDNPPWGG